eukprot:scaffold8593_cov248-Pinguiococcus_pyrenoidosus.AAC.11
MAVAYPISASSPAIAPRFQPASEELPCAMRTSTRQPSRFSMRYPSQLDFRGSDPSGGIEGPSRSRPTPSSAMSSVVRLCVIDSGGFLLSHASSILGSASRVGFIGATRRAYDASFRALMLLSRRGTSVRNALVMFSARCLSDFNTKFVRRTPSRLNPRAVIGKGSISSSGWTEVTARPSRIVEDILDAFLFKYFIAS